MSLPDWLIVARLVVVLLIEVVRLISLIKSLRRG